MLGQNQEWKQNSSCSLFHCISFLHVVHVVMGSVPTLAKTVGKKNLRIPRRSNPPKHPRTALAPQDGVQPQEIQMAIQYRIVPFATADMYSTHVGFSWILSIADTCESMEKGRIFTFLGKLSAITTSSCSYLNSCS